MPIPVRPSPISSETSAIQPLDDVLRQAIAQGASDIHFESGEAEFRVRFRIDGVLRVAATLSPHLRDAMVSRLKILARMDIAEKRLPQDGRIQHPHQGQWVDLRVSSLPTRHGEKLVVRILNVNAAPPSLAALGYEPDDCERLLQALQRPHGMVLMTGPTGSGKTLSLYSCLALLNRTEVNISTVEDPCEIHLPGVNQVSINDKTGLTFATTLRALLRQDPDIIMVGEIRDTETAEIAIQAAQTGHLVLSTLHTNDAPSTLLRLRHMGVPGFHVAASVVLVIAQRLVRRLCEHCKTAWTVSEIASFVHGLTLQEQTLWNTRSFTPYKAVGCSACDRGYKGRLGIYQLMPVSDALQALMLNHGDAQSLARQATAEGMRSLRQAGWLKVMRGLTSVEEVTVLPHHG